MKKNIDCELDLTEFLKSDNYKLKLYEIIKNIYNDFKHDFWKIYMIVEDDLGQPIIVKR